MKFSHKRRRKNERNERKGTRKLGINKKGRKRGSQETKGIKERGKTKLCDEEREKRIDREGNKGRNIRKGRESENE